MALTADTNLARRGPPRSGEFGYPVAPGEKVYRGSLIGLNASLQIQRIQTAGCVAPAGVADRSLDNSASANPSTDKVVGLKGTFAFAVTSADAAHITQPVYASDDNTLTITNTGSLLAVGTLAGIENGQPYVLLAGS